MDHWSDIDEVEAVKDAIDTLIEAFPDEILSGDEVWWSNMRSIIEYRARSRAGDLPAND